MGHLHFSYCPIVWTVYGLASPHLPPYDKKMSNAHLMLKGRRQDGRAWN